MSESPKRKDSAAAPPSSPPREKRNVQEVRAEIRNYIRNERDTILKKWMALKESIASEDVRREQFYARKFKEDTKSLPMNVLKFIGSLKKAVRATMRHKGGTPYSIIRSMFIYWDADKSGYIDGHELQSCMKSLGVKVSLEDCLEIVRYYKPPNLHVDEMDYHELLKDIQRGEPTIIAFVTQAEEEARDSSEVRFEEIGDRFVQMPPIVKKFLEAVRNFLLITMRREGGTPYQHIRQMFTLFDFDYSNGLDPKELVAACRRRMKLAITEAQAKEIVDYYDRKGIGQIYYERFLEDVCQDVKPILTFTELTPRSVEAASRSLAANPFIPKPFNSPPNRVLEKFKNDVRANLAKRVHSVGGTMTSWIREAFASWDRLGTGRISSIEHARGAAKRLGVDLTEEEAHALISCYDVNHNGEMHYNVFIDDMEREEGHFLADPKARQSLSMTTTQRTPPSVSNCLRTISQGLEKFVRRAKGKVESRDLLHGTCLRYDPTRSGSISISALRQVLTELRISVGESDLCETVKWFDSNGSDSCDYNALNRQIFGSDVINERLTLPRIREPSAYSTALMTRARSSQSLGIAQVNKSDPYMTTTLASSLPLSTGFGVKSGTMERNLETIESQAVKNAKMKQKRNKILGEKAKIERRLASIEEQRKKVIEEYKAKKMARALHASQSALQSSQSLQSLAMRQDG